MRNTAGHRQWSCVDLQPDQQLRFLQVALLEHPPIEFSETRTSPWRYYKKNDWFPVADAYTLSVMIRQHQPQRIVEIGSGFSTAVILDSGQPATGLICVEPDPDRRLARLCGTTGIPRIIEHPVQAAPVSIFEELQSGDVLFIDSSHQLAPDGDVTDLLTEIIPRLPRGVLVHFHDILFGESYPACWSERKYSESQAIAAVLACQSSSHATLQILAFNSDIGSTQSQLFVDRFPEFLNNPGGSLWLVKA